MDRGGGPGEAVLAVAPAGHQLGSERSSRLNWERIRDTFQASSEDGVFTLEAQHTLAARRECVLDTLDWS